MNTRLAGMRRYVNPIAAIRDRRSPGIDPLRSLLDSLFGNGEQGAVYIPEPQVLGQQALYQDAAGTVPVAADGDPVGLMLDLSGNGNHATQSTSVARPTYRTDGTLHWLEFDGVDDSLSTSAITYSERDIEILSSINVMGTTRGYVGSIYDATDLVNKISYLEAPSAEATNARFLHRINIASSGSMPAACSFTASTPFVLSGYSDVDAAAGTIRKDGVEISTSIMEQGTGNLPSEPFAIGVRLPSLDRYFTGKIYGLVFRVLAAPSTSADKLNTEKYLAKLAGNLYAVASTVAKEVFVTGASSQLTAPSFAPDADLEAAGRAQALVNIGSLEHPVPATPDSIAVILGDRFESALDQVAALGLEPVPMEAPV